MKERRQRTYEEMRPGCGWLDLYTSPYGFFKEYECRNNGRDWNYFMRRRGVKDDQQDYFTLIQTSSHCYTVTHFCVLDGFNEVQRFGKLFAAAQYLIHSMFDYDQKYVEWQLEQERIKRARQIKRAEAEARRAAKRKATTSD